MVRRIRAKVVHLLKTFLFYLLFCGRGLGRHFVSHKVSSIQNTINKTYFKTFFIYVSLSVLLMFQTHSFTFVQVWLLGSFHKAGDRNRIYRMPAEIGAVFWISPCCYCLWPAGGRPVGDFLAPVVTCQTVSQASWQQPYTSPVPITHLPTHHPPDLVWGTMGRAFWGKTVASSMGGITVHKHPYIIWYGPWN